MEENGKKETGAGMDRHGLLATGHDVRDDEINKGLVYDAERRTKVLDEIGEAMEAMKNDSGLNGSGKEERRRP